MTPKASRKAVKQTDPIGTGAGSISLVRGLSDHLDASLDSIGRFFAAPFQSLMTLLVVAVALSLPAMLYTVVKSVEQNMSDVEKTADISVYFSLDTPADESLRVQALVLSMSGVEAARFLSPEAALKEFQAYSGLGETFSYLDENPLPATLLVTPDMELGAIESLIASVEEFDAVDQVEFDYLWLQRLELILELAGRAVYLLAALLSIGVVLILGNTIRLEIERRRDEVVVVKLVGGTDAFVRRPLLYSGVWYGLLGALIAWFVTNSFVFLISRPLQELSKLYFSEASLMGLNSRDLLVLLCIGSTLGLLGAWLAAARHLAEIEPS